MKKNGIRRFALVLCALVLVLSMAACGGGSSSTPESSVPETPVSSAPESTTPESTTPESTTPDSTNPESSVSGSGLTVEDFVQSDAFQSVMDGLQESVAESGMTLEIKGEGNVLEMIYGIDLGDVSPDDMATQLKSGLTSIKSTFTSLASMFENAGISGAVVRVTYADKSGKVIYSADFTAES